MRGEPWGTPASGPADLVVEGTDADLASWVSGAPGALVRFTPEPGSDVAAALGLASGGRTRGAEQGRGRDPGEGTGIEVPLDALRLADGTLAVNMAILGTAPDRLGRFSRRRDVEVLVDGVAALRGRATTVVVATGQYLRGRDVVPRGHPGDGRIEVQVYRLRPPERRAMRLRLTGGAHVPHPRIDQRSAREVEVRFEGPPWPLEVDGVVRPPVTGMAVSVSPGAYRLLV